MAREERVQTRERESGNRDDLGERRVEIGMIGEGCERREMKLWGHREEVREKKGEG